MNKNIVHKFFEGKRWRNSKRLKTGGKLDTSKDYEEEYYEVGQAKSPAEALGWDYLDGGIGTNWSIIENLIRSYVGKTWDEFYSELCKVAPASSFRGYKVRRAAKSIFNNRNYYVDSSGTIQHKDRKSISIVKM